MNLRHYQTASADAFMQDVFGGGKSGLIVAATGTGKALTISECAKRFLAEYKKPVLVIAHRERLINQLAKTIEGWTGEPVAVEMAEQKAHDTLARITVASVPSLARESRRNRYHAERFGLIIPDEAHHAHCMGWMNVLNHFPNAYRLGFTATPDVAEEKKLPFDKILHEYRLSTAIKEGFLCPIEAELIPIRVDLRGVRTAMGDFKDRDLDDAIIPYLDKITNEIIARPNEKHLIFTPLIASSKLCAEMLNRKGMKTLHLDGTSNGIDEGIAAYERGEYQCLTNSLLMTEGVNIPCVSCITNLRATKSRTLYSQIIGRGTRLHAGKRALTVLDFMWHTKKHLLCRPANLVAESAQVQEIMERKYRNGGKMNVMEAHDVAEEAVKKGLTSLVREIRQHEHKKRELVNPLEDHRAADYKPRHDWEREPASEKQLALLKKQGYALDNMTKGLASHLLSKIYESNDATPAQIHLLQSRGKWVAGMTKQQASQVIDKLMSKYK